MRCIVFVILLAVVVSLPSCVLRPKACITASTLQTTPGVPVTLISCSKNDGSISWDFGDGTHSTGPAVRKAYDTIGTYTVTLTAQNSKGTSTEQVTVQVTALPVVPIICSYADTVYTGESVLFTSCSENTVSCEWKFSDGFTITGSEVSRVFMSAGNYTVELIVTGFDGKKDTAYGSILTVIQFIPDTWNGSYGGIAECSVIGNLSTSISVFISGININLYHTTGGNTTTLTGTYFQGPETFVIPTQTVGNSTYEGNGLFTTAGNKRVLTFAYTVTSVSFGTVNCTFHGEL